MDSTQRLLITNKTSSNTEPDLNIFQTNIEFRRRINKDAQIAYMCLVFLLCLMLLSLYLLRGFHSRNYNKKDVSLLHLEKLPTVNDVVFAKAKYLPMFQRKDNEYTVYVHDCGNDP